MSDTKVMADAEPERVEVVREPPRWGMWANLGARIVEAEPGRVVVEAILTAEAHGFKSSRGVIVHGGALAALADCAVAASAASVAGDGRTTATSDLKVDFFRPARPGRMVARGQVRHRARRLAFCEASIEQEDGTVVAEARAVMVFIEV